MKKQVNLINFNLHEDSEILSQLKERFEFDKDIFFETIHFYKEVNKKIRNDKQALLLFKIETKAEFVQIMATIKANADLIQQGYLKPICLFGVNSKKVERILFKYGCSEILPINVNPKTFIIKSELAIKTIHRLINHTDDYLTLAQRQQESDKISNGDYKFKEIHQDEFFKDEDELDQELEDLLEGFEYFEYNDDLEDEDDDELESMLDEIDDDIFEQNEKESLILETTEESVPELVDYINENNELSQLNLETGYLGLGLGLDENSKINCVFESFEEEHMVLEVAHDYQVGVGEEISVWIKFVYNKCKMEIELSGKVSEVEEIDANIKHVRIDFIQNEVDKYDYFMELYQKRQKNINDFMELAKGY